MSMDKLFEKALGLTIAKFNYNYQVLPSVFTKMDVLEHGQCNDTHTVIVVSPLEYIRVQQVENLKCLGIQAASFV